MKSLLFIFLMCFSFHYVQSQPNSNDCHKANAFLDELSYKYYWGTPEWIALMDSAIAMCPTSAKAWGNKAMIYLMRGDVSMWSTLIQKAVDNDPLYYLGNRAWHRLRYLKDYEGALRDLQKQDSIASFHTIYVSDVHNYMLMGQCMEGMENMENALSFYDKAIEKQNKERGEDWVGTYDYLIRGILKFKMNDWDGALNDFDKQIKSYEQLADTYYYRAMVYRKMEQVEDAKSDLTRAKSLITDEGFRRWDQQVLLMNEINLSDIDEALASLK